jgi:hypothetical protein
VGKTRILSTSAGVTLDAGALIALDKGDRRMIALLQQTLAHELGFRGWVAEPPTPLPRALCINPI